MSRQSHPPSRDNHNICARIPELTYILTAYCELLVIDSQGEESCTKSRCQRFELQEGETCRNSEILSVQLGTRFWYSHKFIEHTISYL